MTPTIVMRDPGAGGWLRFAAREIVEASHLDEVRPALDRAASAVQEGHWLAGFLAYEAAPALDPVLSTRDPAPGPLPLAWWAICPEPTVLASPPGAGRGGEPQASMDWRPGLDRAAHLEAVEQIHRLIAAGDTYQVNLTFPLRAAYQGSAQDLFLRLWSAQRAPYAAWLETEHWAVCSASPELFFRQEGDRLTARPMKGTSRRGRSAAEDEARLDELRSEKNRAENLMITDMMRNDLGRLAHPGSVQVRRLFAAETYPTVHQLVSEVVAETEAEPHKVLRTLFPCASITGAPKKRTMELIRELEAEPRGLYTGALGWMAPGRRAQLSVAIRTVTLDKEVGEASYGVGGGIVWDSEPAAEYDECRAKALVLTGPRPRFELLETLAWRPRRGFLRLARHLDRMAASAAYFGYPFDRRGLEGQLAKAAATFADERHRIRLRLDAEGRLELEAARWPCEGRRTWTFTLDDRPVDHADPFLFHKTTHRHLYEQAQARHPRVDEVLLWNESGHLTEGCRTNVVLRFGTEFLTPPESAGLLPGIYRGALLARGRLKEAELPLAALDEADAIFLVNSLRGWIRAEAVTCQRRILSPGRLSG